MEEQDALLLEWHNKTVKNNDHCSFLGDLTMRRGGKQCKEDFIKEMKRYNGHRRLYLGNHDHFPIRVYLDAGFEKVYATWRDEQGVLFSHFPLHPSSIGSAKGNVHGHTHGNPDLTPVMWVDKDQKTHIVPYVNISVERTAYKPITYDEVLERIEKAKDLKEG